MWNNRVTVRYLDVTNEHNDNEICETFLGFTSVDGSTGKGLTDVVLRFLEKNKLDLKQRRSQGHDNAANMRGKNNGVQKKLSDQNPLAFFMPCECHNLNLVLCDAAKCSVKSVTLFGAFGRLYCLSAAPVNRRKSNHINLSP
jgi:hypothetical protein